MASLIFLNFPIAYIVLKVGLPVYTVWIVRIVVNLVTMTARCVYMQKKLDFPLLPYFRNVLVPILAVTIVALPIPVILNYIVDDFWTNLLVVGFTTLIVTMFDVYFVGMNSHEKEMARNMIFKKIPIFKSRF